MAQLGWHVDIEQCIACRGCQVACKQELVLPAGIDRRRVLVQEGMSPTGRPFRQHVTVACMHCEQPACVAACPVERYWKDTAENEPLRVAFGLSSNPVTGLVLIKPGKEENPEAGVDCIRCRRCVAACPFGAARVDTCRSCGQCTNSRKHPGGRPAEKCTGCYHRLFDLNLPEGRRKPACVITCPSGALTFGELSGFTGSETTWDGAPPPGAREIADPSLTRPSVRFRPLVQR